MPPRPIRLDEVKHYTMSVTVEALADEQYPPDFPDALRNGLNHAIANLVGHGFPVFIPSLERWVQVKLNIDNVRLEKFWVDGGFRDGD